LVYIPNLTVKDAYWRSFLTKKPKIWILTVKSDRENGEKAQLVHETVKFVREITISTSAHRTVQSGLPPLICICTTFHLPY
jgi:hypothetical protein